MRRCMYTHASYCIVMKSRRQAVILDIVRREAVRSQEQLRLQLAARGMTVTQATLSRDIRDLGLVKHAGDGAYRDEGGAPDPVGETARHQLQRAARECLTGAEPSQQLLVLRTGAGQASMLAVAIDRARLPGVLGTIAGDDTLLVIGRDIRTARATMRQLLAFTEERA